MRTLLPILLALALHAGAHAEAPPAWNGELRAHVELQRANGHGPLAEANRIAPGTAATPRDAAALEAGLRGQLRFVSADLYLRQERREGGAHAQDARFNELYASGEAPSALPGEGVQWSAGKKVVAWDVGYAFRPNDVVQVEPRRLLLAPRPEGRPLLQLEGFNIDSAWTLVWANPHHLNTPAGEARRGEESALALRAYWRAGAADWHGFLRWGERTQGSVGSALAWVASESVELHASARWMRRHDGFAPDAVPGAGGLPVAGANPWREATLGAASQWLLGATWTNADQVSVLAEVWHDGTTLPDTAWDTWNARNAALSALGTQPGLPSALHPALAGNLAWQATPWNVQNLRRDAALLRVSWKHEGWEPVAELLVNPADRGRALTASLAWQGDRWRLEGGLRQYGGPSDALLAQLPARRTGFLAATLAF